MWSVCELNRSPREPKHTIQHRMNIASDVGLTKMYRALDESLWRLRRLHLLVLLASLVVSLLRELEDDERFVEVIYES